MQTKKHSIQNNSFSLHSNREPLITFYRKEEIIVLNDKLKLIYLNPSAIKFTNCTNFHGLEKFMVLNHFNFKTKKEFYHHFKWLLKYKSNISFLMESCDSKIFPLFKVKKPAQLILTFKPKYSDLNGLFSGIAIFAHIRNKTRQTNWLNNEKKISHELKNHLCNLNSVVETTEEYFLLLSQYQKKLFFVTIKNEITYLEHLIKSLPILENVHSQILPLTDFNVILDYIAKSYSVILKRKRLQLQIELSKKNSCIVGNIDSVIQVLSNLINNSVKFNYQGGKIFIRSFEIKKKKSITLFTYRNY
jgi:signal transduction histidine kinase